ncbi:hypothetical protein BO443_20411 [Burkholderia orbicola]
MLPACVHQPSRTRMDRSCRARDTPPARALPLAFFRSGSRSCCKYPCYLPRLSLKTCLPSYDCAEASAFEFILNPFLFFFTNSSYEVRHSRQHRLDNAFRRFTIDLPSRRNCIRRVSSNIETSRALDISDVVTSSPHPYTFERPRAMTRRAQRYKFFSHSLTDIPVRRTRERDVHAARRRVCVGARRR